MPSNKNQQATGDEGQPISPQVGRVTGFWWLLRKFPSALMQKQTSGNGRGLDTGQDDDKQGPRRAMEGSPMS